MARSQSSQQPSQSQPRAPSGRRRRFFEDRHYPLARITLRVLAHRRVRRIRRSG